MMFYALVGLMAVAVGWVIARCIGLARLHQRIKQGF
jgi:hypothetical protein